MWSGAKKCVLKLSMPLTLASELVLKLCWWHAFTCAKTVRYSLSFHHLPVANHQSLPFSDEFFLSAKFIRHFGRAKLSVSPKSSLTIRQSLFAIHIRFNIRQSPIAIRCRFWFNRSLTYFRQLKRALSFCVINYGTKANGMSRKL